MTMLPTILKLVVMSTFLAVGLPKLLGIPAATGQVTRFGFSVGFARLVGASEVVAAGLMGWGLRDDRALAAGAVIIIAIMIGALHQQVVRAKDPIWKWAPAEVFLIIAATLLGMTI